jgi:hypothetical protein
MRKVWLGVLALVLCGCADSSPLIDRAAGGKLHGDADHVDIAAGRLDALPLAIAHCARYGRSAQWSHADGDHSVYDCVAHP